MGGGGRIGGGTFTGSTLVVKAGASGGAFGCRAIGGAEEVEIPAGGGGETSCRLLARRRGKRLAAARSAAASILLAAVGEAKP